MTVLLAAVKNICGFDFVIYSSNIYAPKEEYSNYAYLWVSTEVPRTYFIERLPKKYKYIKGIFEVNACNERQHTKKGPVTFFDNYVYSNFPRVKLELRGN